tara:strand:+ start:2355 stop:2624 length:270 start_codon:yes stop_codon:yes gene_type:complete
MSRTAEEIAQAHAACLGGASTINSVIATHNKGASATSEDFGNDLTHAEKKERVTRSVGYLKHQKTLTDWTSESFTDIDAAISAADAFTA